MTLWYTELDQFYDLSITVYCDNEAAIILAKNANRHSKIKHVWMKAHWIREIIEAKEVIVKGISTEENIADKGITPPETRKIRQNDGYEGTGHLISLFHLI